MTKGTYKHKPQQGFQKGHPCYKGSEKGWFKKGLVPWMKGRKGIHHSPKTEFKKGNKPWNTGKERPEMMGEKNPAWKGGQITSVNGYILIRMQKRGYIKQARLVAEKHLGRFLTSKEIIHHINEIKNDDRPENLYLFENCGKHIGYHHLKNKPILVSNII